MNHDSSLRIVNDSSQHFVDVPKQKLYGVMVAERGWRHRVSDMVAEHRGSERCDMTARMSLHHCLSSRGGWIRGVELSGWRRRLQGSGQARRGHNRRGCGGGKQSQRRRRKRARLEEADARLKMGTCGVA
jgi:hypothetical protein